MGTCCCPERAKEDGTESEALLRVDKLSIRILSWNVNAVVPSNTKSLEKLLATRADIMVIGLQEIIDLNAMNMIKADDDTDNKWDNLIMQVLSTSPSKKKKKKKKSILYSKIKQIRLMGILLLIYCRDTVRDDIRDCMANKIGTGLLGTGPNKGGVAVRFECYKTNLVFICGHLAAHKPNVADRNENYQKIMNKLVFTREEVGDDDIKQSQTDLGILTVDTHDLIFFFGDLNYRIDIDDVNQVNNFIEKSQYGELMKCDQLKKQIEEKKAFDGFKENEIGFQPTFKFVIGKEREYDTKRIPAYCDRILWKMGSDAGLRTEGRKIECLEYESFIDECMSDHKPVAGLFELKFQMYL